MKSFCLLVAVSCCLAVAFAKTQCEEQRERELANDSKIKLVPKCTAEGDYEAYQCFQGNPFCLCFRPDGSQISNPSMDLKTCVCPVHEDKALTLTEEGKIGHMIPVCNEDGTYSKRQCWGSTGYCWCADELGNRISEEVRGDIDC